MMVWVWIALGGATFVAAIVFSLRLARRGTTTLDDDRARGRARIRQTEEEIFEEQNRMTLEEHLCIARAGLEDVVRLAGGEPRLVIEDVPLCGNSEAEIVLRLSGETLRVRLNMRECLLGGGRMVRRRVTWHLLGTGIDEEYDDLAALMRTVSQRLGVGLEKAGIARHSTMHTNDDANPDVAPELPHFARRFAHRINTSHQETPTLRKPGSV